MKAQSFFYALPIAAGILCSAIAAENGVTANPNKAGDGVQVGVAGRDGVTVSGGEAYVTRNGAMEKLSKDLALPSGVVAQPDGTIVLKDGTKAALKASQILTFEGKVVELPPNAGVNDNPNPQPSPQSTGSTSAIPQRTATGGTTTSNSGMRFDRGNQGAGGSIFIDGGGNPFMGTLGADGTIVTSDGRTIAFDGRVRAVTFGTNGQPALGTINNNGTVTQADGSVLFADGSVRTADGQVIAPPRDAQGNPMRSGIPANTTNVPLQNANGQPANTNANTGNNNVPATTEGGNTQQTNSPNNAGTVNRTNQTQTNRVSPNNSGTVNNPNSTATGNTNATGNANNTTNPNATGTTGGTRTDRTGTQAGRSGARPSGARNGGSSGGTGTGTGASGAGGASGGSGGGATR